MYSSFLDWHCFARNTTCLHTNCFVEKNLSDFKIKRKSFTHQMSFFQFLFTQISVCMLLVVRCFCSYREKAEKHCTCDTDIWGRARGLWISTAIVKTSVSPGNTRGTDGNARPRGARRSLQRRRNHLRNYDSVALQMKLISAEQRWRRWQQE